MLGSFRLATQSTRRRLGVLDLPTRDRACLRILLRAKVATTSIAPPFCTTAGKPPSSGSCDSGGQASSNALSFHH